VSCCKTPVHSLISSAPNADNTLNMSVQCNSCGAIYDIHGAYPVAFKTQFFDGEEVQEATLRWK
jgi:hypothetical protein